VKTNKGYGLVILIVVVAIVAFWAVKIIGKPANTADTATSTSEQEVKQATTPTGIIQTKAKAQAAADQGSAYNKELNDALEQ